MTKLFLKIAPFLLILVIGVGIVPGKYFPVFLLGNSAIYIGLIFTYSKFAKKPIKKLPETLLLILYCVLVCSIAVFTFFPINPAKYPNDPRDYHLLAKNLVQLGTYGLDTSITAYRPVGYPLFLALIYLLSGTFNYKLVVVIQFILNLASVYLLWRAMAKFLDEKLANLAILIYAFNIPLLFVSNVLLTETLTQFLVILILFCLGLVSSGDSKLKTFSISILIGLSASELVLTRPNYALYLPIIFILLFIKQNKKSAITFLLIVIIILGSWTYRNYKLSGEIVFVSTNSGINMFLGNNPYVINGRAATWPPKDYINTVTNNDSESRSPSKIQLGEAFTSFMHEIKYDSNFKKAAVKWIIENPEEFLELSFSRLRFLFIPNQNLFSNLEYLNNPQEYQYNFLLLFQSLAFWVMLFLSITGIFTKRGVIVLLASVPYILLILITFSDTRFQIPLFIPMSVLSSLGIYGLAAGDRKTLITKVALACLLVIPQLITFKYTLINPFKYFTYKATMAIAENKITEKKVVKTYAENQYLNGKVKYKQGYITLDPDVFSYVEKEDKPSVLVYRKNGLFDFPVFETVNISDFAKYKTHHLEKELTSNRPEVFKRVFIFEPKENFKYLKISFTLFRYSEIKINGANSFVISSYPKEDDKINVSIYIPSELAKPKLEIYLSPAYLPTSVVSIPMDTNESEIWRPDLAKITSIELLY